MVKVQQAMAVGDCNPTGSFGWDGTIAKASETETYWKPLMQVQKCPKNCFYILPESELVILVIAGVIPVARLAMKHQAVHRRKSEVSNKTTTKEERSLEFLKTSFKEDG